MINLEAAQRYARALFELSNSSQKTEVVLNEIREITRAIEMDSELKSFITDPLIPIDQLLQCFNALFAKKAFSQEVQGLITTMIRKRRLNLISEVESSYQALVDSASGVIRGAVRSASTLLPDERRSLESTISKFTNKRAVLEYHEDPKLVGGLIAKVGSYTFDDSLDTQLSLMNDSLKKRRSN